MIGLLTNRVDQGLGQALRDSRRAELAMRPSAALEVSLFTFPAWPTRQCMHEELEGTCRFAISTLSVAIGSARMPPESAVLQPMFAVLH